ncbi:MAG: pyrroline-5-carboxylate reductase [Phycisphaerales bacterium]
MAVKIERLIVVGYGNMGKAIVDGALRRMGAPGTGGDELRGIALVDPVKRDMRHEWFKGTEGLKQVASVEALDELGGLAPGDVVLLSVKPQVFKDVAPGLRALLAKAERKGVTVVSVMAGVTCAKMHEALGPTVPIVRAMPNLAAMVGQSASAFCLGPAAYREHAEIAGALLRAIGPEVLELSEMQLDAFTAVAGSGPAYVFYLAEAMIAGAVAAGMDAKTADQAVRQTLVGAAEVLRLTMSDPAALRANVTSKGGTTEAAVGVLDEHGVRAAIEAAVIAARLRARELSR